ANVRDELTLEPTAPLNSPPLSACEHVYAGVVASSQQLISEGKWGASMKSLIDGIKFFRQTATADFDRMNKARFQGWLRDLQFRLFIVETRNDPIDRDGIINLLRRVDAAQLPPYNSDSV